jgi:hypothetical protein
VVDELAAVLDIIRVYERQLDVGRDLVVFGDAEISVSE